jgi:outer membrane usher protein
MGGAARLAWQWLAPTWSTALRLTVQTDRYANLSLAPAADRTQLDAEASFGVTLSRSVGLGAELHAGRYRDLGPFTSASGRVGVQVPGGVWLSLTMDYGRAAGGPVGLQVLALLTFGRAGYSADAGVTRDRTGQATESISATKALPRDTGWGFRAHATRAGGDQTFDGALQGQTSFGRADAEMSRVAGMTTYHASAAGAVTYIDRRLFLSRPTDGSFALVETNVPNVGVTLENGFVGRTGSDGSLLVPDLQPYYGSKLAIRDRDVPVEYEPGRTSRSVAPPLRGGAIVAFDVRRISAIAGRLFVGLPVEEKRPVNGELSVIVDGELRASPIDDGGRFFLERMPPGKHVVQAVWGGGSCRAVVTLPERAPPIFDAGEVRCILDTLDPSGRIPTLRDPGYGALPAEPDTGAGSGGR